MITDLEGLIAKYGGFVEINALWKRVAGRPFFSREQMKSLTEDTVETFSLAGNSIVMLGTAHTSRRSGQLVETWVKRLQPSTLVLERCPERLAELTWPKALLMDCTASLRAVEVAGRGEISVDDLRKLVAPSKAIAKSTDEELEAIASQLWADFELLNTERNAQVEEAAFLAWSRQNLGKSGRLLALADMRASLTGVTSGEGGGGPDRKSLLASMHARDTHICGCIAACAFCTSGPILVILGQSHLSGVSAILVKSFEAQPITEERINRDVEKKRSCVRKVQHGDHFTGALLRAPAIVEMTQLYACRNAELQQGKFPAEELLNAFIEDVEGDEASFHSFVHRGLAIEFSSSPAQLQGQEMIDTLSTWVQHGVQNRSGVEILLRPAASKL